MAHYSGGATGYSDAAGAHCLLDIVKVSLSLLHAGLSHAFPDSYDVPWGIQCTQDRAGPAADTGKHLLSVLSFRTHPFRKAEYLPVLPSSLLSKGPGEAERKPMCTGTRSL